jgi:histone H3/H4
MVNVTPQPQHSQPQLHPSQQQQQYSQNRPSSQGYASSGQQQHPHQPQYSSTNNPMYGSGMVPTQDPMRNNNNSNNIGSASSPGMQRGSRPAPVITSPQPAAYRPSKTATTNTLASSKPREPAERSPHPTSIESKLTMQSSAAIPSAIQPYMAPLVGQRIQDLVSSLDPSYTIDSQAQEQLLQLADDFLDKVCKQSLRLATHRGSTIMEVQDVQLVLAKQWGIVIPGLGPPQLNKSRAAPIQSSTVHSGKSSKQTSGTKRKSSSSHKSASANTSTGTTHHQAQPNKSSKQNESNQVNS